MRKVRVRSGRANVHSVRVIRGGKPTEEVTHAWPSCEVIGVEKSVTVPGRGG
jgi:hypothetical protein